MNICIVGGNLGRDPEISFTSDGTAICKASIAINTWKKGEKGSFWTYLTAFGKTAELMGKHFRKGDPIVVSARYDVQEYEKDGEKKRSHSFIVNQIEFIGGGKQTEDKPQDAPPKPKEEKPKKQEPEDKDGELPF